MAIRVFGTVFILGLLHVLLFLLSNELSRGVKEWVIGLSLLFVLPASVAALLVFLTDMSGKRTKKHYSLMPVWMMGLILIVSAITLREGTVCILMITPFWLVGAWFGSQTVYRLQEKYKIGGGLNCMILAVLPFLALFGETFIPQQTQHYVVSRNIVIDAPVEKIWPLLVTLDDIQPEEGRWNITQNVMGIPKPAMATVDTTRMPYVRHAQWGENVTFEEHITQFDENRHMRWDFVFPNESVSEYTDRHISADGYHLKIKTGGYDLVSLSPTQTQLVLKTEYRATSPVNLYAKMWGELILGDIQNNILHLIHDRAETQGESIQQ